MTISPCLESLIPFVRHARTVPDSLMIVRKISNIKVNPSVSCNGHAGLSVSPLLKRNVQRSFTKTNVRTVCGRENCADPCDFPKCSEENLAKVDCVKKKAEPYHEPTVYERYWDRPECCDNDCLEAFPRFDDLLYRESDKEKRIYTQTWTECPPVVIKPKAICCTEQLDLPPLCKRPKAERPNTACASMDCRNDGKCPKFKLPCCGPSTGGQCIINKLPLDCKKYLAPSPSFSECRKPELKKLRITECWCLAIPSMCQVWAEWRRLQMLKRQ